MEITLGEMRKLFSRSPAEGSSRPPIPIATPQKEKQWEELKTRLQQRSVKEVIAEVAKIEVPPTKFPVATPATTPIVVKTKKAKKDLETRTTSSESSSERKSTKKKKKEPTPELESEEESTAKDTGHSGGDPESEEEAKPMTPPPAKKKEIET